MLPSAFTATVVNLFSGAYARFASPQRAQRHTRQPIAQPVDMSPKVYDLLTYLVRNQGVGLTREQLISNVWGYDFYGDDRTLDTHIKLLRLALGPYRDHVVTIRGYGYRFDA